MRQSARPSRRSIAATSAPFAVALVVIVALFAPSPAPAQAYADLAPAVRAFVAVESPHVLIRDVRLIDGTGSPAREAMTVEVRDGRVVRVAPADSVGDVAGAQVVDGSGQTLIPGLVMLHEHMFYPSGQARYNTNEVSFPPLYLAGGATTIRTGGSVDPYTDLTIARHVDEGRIPGPRMDVTAPYLEGPGGFIRAFPVIRTPADARSHVDFWADRGATSYKAYMNIDRASLGAAIEAAHARGLKVTGHLCSVTYREAAELGIDNLEHGFFAATDWVAGKEPDQCPPGGVAQQSYLELDVEGVEFRGLVRHLIDRSVAITSTLTVVERRAPDRPPPPPGALDAMLPQLREQVEARLEAARRGGPRGGELLARYMAMEKAFHNAGGLLVVGTDPTGGGDVVPGYANQRALQLLMEMGLSVEEAVRVATLNGARYLGRDDDVGSIATGKRADLVLLDGDPAADPDAFRRMTLVFKDGVGYDSRRLFESVRGTVGLR
jgi:imidazolonepropionase-like amidohydrolase